MNAAEGRTILLPHFLPVKDRISLFPAYALFLINNQRLRPVYGQAVVLCITGVKADDIVVALYVLFSLVLAVFEVGAHTRYGEILPAAIKGRYTVIVTGDKPPVFIKGGLHGKLVMLKS